MFNAIRESLNIAQNEAKEFLQREGHKPKVFTWNNLLSFFNSIPLGIKLMREEPEILVFAFLQWIAIYLAYIGWTQMLYWIPDSIWNAAHEASLRHEKHAFDLINIVLSVWSFFIVCLVSYPIGLCNAAMVAVHDLRTCHEEVTLAKCLAIADRHLGKIWAFTSIDAWITVKAIFERLPSKNNRHTAFDELLYYAWKIATMGVVPALVNGRDYVDAGNDSVKLLMTAPIRTLGLRFGYSAVCWVIGVLSYIAAVFFAAIYGVRGEGAHYIYSFYLLMGFPIFVSVGIVVVIIRPFFLLAVAKLYTDTFDTRCEIEHDIASVSSLQRALFSWRLGIFLLMLGLLLIAIFYGDQLGLTAWIHKLAQKDLLR